MKIALVEWLDSYTYGNWHTPDPKEDHVASCVSIGVVLLEDGKQVTLAQSLGITSGHVSETISIPRGCIKRIRYLKVASDKQA